MPQKQISVADLERVQEKAIDEYFWHNFFNEDVRLCSLCGNSGVIDTRNTAVSGGGINAGRLNYCICPNGRAMREEGADMEAYMRIHKDVAAFLNQNGVI